MKLGIVGTTTGRIVWSAVALPHGIEQIIIFKFYGRGLEEKNIFYVAMEPIFFRMAVVIISHPNRIFRSIEPRQSI